MQSWASWSTMTGFSDKSVVCEHNFAWLLKCLTKNVCSVNKSMRPLQFSTENVFWKYKTLIFMHTTLHVIVDNFIPANCQCAAKTHYTISKQQTYYCKWTWNYYIHLVKQTFAPTFVDICLLWWIHFVWMSKLFILGFRSRWFIRYVLNNNFSTNQLLTAFELD